MPLAAEVDGHAVLRGSFDLTRVSRDGGTREVGAQQAEQRGKHSPPSNALPCHEAFHDLDRFPSGHILPRAGG
jgi:hypothetical protein